MTGIGLVKLAPQKRDVRRRGCGEDDLLGRTPVAGALSQLRLWRQLGVISTMAIACLLSACGSTAEEATGPRPVLTVDLVSLSSESWPDTITASGEVSPWQEASIGTEISGVRLEEVLVDVGDVVRRGQLLARYDAGILQADLVRLDATVAEMTALLAKAKAEAVRAERLVASDAMSKQMVQAYLTQAEVAEAQFTSAKAQRNAQALRVRNAKVIAPDDGVISARSASVGAVSMSGAELFRLVRRGRLEWRAELPAESLALLRPGAPVALRAPDGSEVKATVRNRSPTVDPHTRNGIVYVDLPRDRGLTAGMYITGRFTLASRPALTVPESAVVVRDGNPYLMRVDEQARVHEVKVATGRRRDNAIEIAGIVDPSARFIRSGGAFISDGDLVKVAAKARADP